MKWTAVFFLLATLSLQAAEPVLVGHWKLDEKDGDVAADSSPAKKDAKAMNGPGRAAGKVDGAFTFDNAKKQYVEIPSSPELDKLQGGSYTVCAWFKAENAPPGTEDANDAQYAIVCKIGWHEGISYDSNKKFIFTHWLKGDTDPQWKGIGTWDTEYEPGEWHYVAGVVDKDAHVAKIYVDGELKGTTEEWDAKAEAKDFESLTWKIGSASPAADKWAWNAKASIDDVRMYTGAMNDDQMKKLYESVKK